jgi:hypothetical protein
MPELDGDEESSEENAKEHPEQESHTGRWNLKFKKLRDYCGKHGDCELSWDVHRFTFILNTPTNTPPDSLPALQAMCHNSTRKTGHWTNGSTVSVLSSKMANWILNEKGGSTKMVSTSQSL